jgi:hypothetical protein
MGWNTYYGLGGDFDEDEVKEVADALVDRGLAEAGYDIVWLDGGWTAKTPRDDDGNLVADPDRFPSGMKALTDYIHGKGLRAGIYTEAGPYIPGTCGLGSHGYYQEDADLFAEWEFDAVKVDFLCGIAGGLDPKSAFTEFAEALRNNSSDRPMIFNLCNPVTSPDWGDYPEELQSIYSWSYAPDIAQSWRTYTDVGFVGFIRFPDVLRNFDANAAHPEVAGPGHWNDPDYLGPELGMTPEEFRTQMSLWSVAADGMWPHAPAMLALAGMLLAWRRSRPAAVALCAAAAVLIRPHLLVAVLVVALFAWRRERPPDAVAMASGAFAGLLALTTYTAWAFGTVLPIAGYDASGHLGGLLWHSPWQTVQALGLAFISPTRGLLVFSPVLLPALIGLATTWRRLPPWTLASALAGLLYLLVQVRAVGYSGGDDFFAYRISLETLLLATPALVLAVAPSIRRLRWQATAVALLALASIGVHAYGAVAGGITDDTIRAWEAIDTSVRDQHNANAPLQWRPAVTAPHPLPQH